MTVQTCAVGTDKGLGRLLQGLEGHLVSLKEMLLLHKRLMKTQQREQCYPRYVLTEDVNIVKKCCNVVNFWIENLTQIVFAHFVRVLERHKRGKTKPELTA